MELFKAVIQTAVGLFKIDFTLFGVTFNFWQVFLFTIVAGIVIWFISEVFFGG